MPKEAPALEPLEPALRGTRPRPLAQPAIARPRKAPIPGRRRAHSLLLVGCNRRTRRFLDELTRRSGPPVEILGYLDLATGPAVEPGEIPADRERLEVPCLGQVDELARVLTETPVDEVYVTLPIKSCYDEIEDAVRTCEQAGVPVSVSVDLFERSIAQSGTAPGRITYTCVPYPRWKLGLKRAMDLIGSVTALTLLAIPMLFIALGIRLTSRGPVLFRQRRIGLHHKPFDMLKFRTMVTNAEALRAKIEHLNEQEGPVFKIKDDPRVTRIGRFLRRYSLDELPQLLNVLRGEMSLVGPRPPIASEVAQYEWWQRRRLSMKPGLTCFWQVMGRNEICFDEWMRLDLQYIDNWSPGLDIHLLLKTIPVVLRGAGAS